MSFLKKAMVGVCVMLYAFTMSRLWFPSIYLSANELSVTFAKRSSGNSVLASQEMRFHTGSIRLQAGQVSE